MTTTLKPDNKGRITLGKLATGVSSFSVDQDKMGRIILEPRVEIPQRELWLYRNETALKSVKRGLAESGKGKTKKRKSYAEYVDEVLD